jgi:hypothetical protein
MDSVSDVFSCMEQGSNVSADSGRRPRDPSSSSTFSRKLIIILRQWKDG